MRWWGPLHLPGAEVMERVSPWGASGLPTSPGLAFPAGRAAAPGRPAPTCGAAAVAAAAEEDRDC